MKIKEILNRVDKSKQFEDTVSVSDMASDMNIHNVFNYNDDDRLTSYFIGNWYCTDSYVGYKVYFFDNEPVAVSSQTGRKMTENIEWISKELYKKVKDYVLSFSQEEEDNISLCDLDEEIGETYKIEYHGQLFQYHKDIALYKGDSVKICEYHKGNSINKEGKYEPSLVNIQLQNKEKIWIELKELDFPYNTIK